MRYRSTPLEFNSNAGAKAMNKLATEFKRFLQPYWLDQRSPIDNRKWAVRKDKLTHPILRKTGQLFNTVIFRSDNDKIIANMVDYGIFHQFGTEKMPDRPWLGLTDDAVEFFVDKFLESIIND